MKVMKVMKVMHIKKISISLIFYLKKFWMLVLIPFIIYFYLQKIGVHSAYASRREECYPFPSPNSDPDKFYKVIGGSGEITESNYSKIVPVGFGKDWQIDTGSYDPNKKQILIYLKDRWIGIFLSEPLTENRAIDFTAIPCGRLGSAYSFRSLIKLPALVIDNYSMTGSLVKTNNRIKGSFSLENQFWIHDNINLINLKINTPYKGQITGEFYLNVQPGYPTNLPLPNLENSPIPGLW